MGTLFKILDTIISTELLALCCKHGKIMRFQLWSVNARKFGNNLKLLYLARIMKMDY